MSLMKFLVDAQLFIFLLNFASDWQNALAVVDE
jgi:hypothetical protein